MGKKKKSGLRIARIVLAVLSVLLLTGLFVNLSGIGLFSFLAKAQFMPALLSANFLVLAILVVVTLLFGRVYCSVICPLGITQDFFNWLTKLFGGKKKAMRFSWLKPHNVLRYTILGVYALSVIIGVGAFTALLDPYGAFGRILTSIFQPSAVWVNNLMAGWWPDSYGREPYLAVNCVALSVAIVTFLVVGFLSCRSGRTYCNNICPVGSLLGLLSRCSAFKVQIDEDKCTGCGLCGKKCRASCIDTANHKVDYSRCVDCFDCLENCAQGAIRFKPVKMKKQNNEGVDDESRRKFLSAIAVAGMASTKLWAQEKVEKVDAAIQGKETKEHVPVSPFGSVSHKRFNDKCTACHLCVAKCPNKVLRPSMNEYGLAGVMQPVMDYTRGYCDYDCTLCSEVCPAGAIEKLTADEKQGIRIGLAVFDRSACVVETDDVTCGNCQAHCPAGAIKLVPDYNAPIPGAQGRQRFKVFPQIEAELCIGCGACQYHCPAGAIRVEGYEVHK